MINSLIVFRARRITVGLAVCAAAWLAPTLPAEGADEELLKYVPASSNALVVIDVQSLLVSQMAISNGWGDRDSLEYSERPIMVPPEAETAVVAAQLDAGNQLARIWELAILGLQQEVALDHIARTEGGYVDTINETQVVWTPSDAFVVDLGAPKLGIVYPADRQYVSRWVGFARRNESPVISEYLQSAADLSSPTTQIVMALDLLDAADPHRVQEGLSTSETLAGSPEERMELITSLVTGIRGLTLTINVSARARGKLRIDFSDDTSILRSQAKPLILEALDRFNAHIPDMDIWVVRTEGQSIELEGNFSESGLRRVASLLEIPTEKFSALHDDAPAEPGSDDYTRASLAYYRGVKALLDDLRETLGDTRDNHALWMERYARKVDAMPILNVDDELLDWGATIAETFRSMGLGVRQSGIRGGVRSAQARGSDNYYGGYSRYGRYGYYASNDSQSRTNVIRAEERGRERMGRYESWNELENATADIRRSMTQKYGVEF